MTRALPEWIAKHDDQAVPPRVQLRVFLAFGGKCQCGCKHVIRSGERWQLDHKVALINGGEHRETNLQPMLVEHHKNKTADDVAQKSRTYRKRKRHYGLHKAMHVIPGSKASPFKKRMDGTVERR